MLDATGSVVTWRPIVVYVFVEMDRSTVSKLIASLRDESIITAEHYVEVRHPSVGCHVVS